ncbi:MULTISPECIES: O-antigen polymerase [Vibrio]|uniref:O-antigen polymerase n=1 Tax=Vibrio TaxID=662 RepID=UPI0021C3C061|nr:MULTISPECIES: O-antigen polymerase [Vibrio]MDE1319348.1 oligosaccharide repeat unit polymerase [Vibrio aestuarianus]MDF9399674.1 oligosaccharide repeat unit polymerase [Vibrio sp. 1180_3]
MFENKVNAFTLGTVVILFPWLIVTLMRVFGPVTHVIVSVDLIIYLMCFVLITYASYFVGFFSINKKSKLLKVGGKLGASTGLVIQIRNLFFILLTIYVILAYIDFLIIKNGSFSGIVEQRESEHLSGPRNSIIGLLIFFLSGTPPIFASILFYTKCENRKAKLFYYTLVFLGFAAMFLSGGRNAFFISTIYCLSFIMVYKVRNKNNGINLKKLCVFITIFIGVLYSLSMFLTRFEVQGLDVHIMLDYLEREYNLLIYRIPGLPIELQPIYSVFVYLSFYVTHPFTYLNDYFELAYSPYLMGGYNFYIIVRMIDVLFGTQFYQTGSELILQSGVYLTFPGTLFLDFGYIGGLLVGALFGFSYGFLTRRLGSSVISSKLWFAFITVIMIFSPIYSVIGMANGWSLLFLITCTTFLSLRVRQRD